MERYQQQFSVESGKLLFFKGDAKKPSEQQKQVKNGKHNAIVQKCVSNRGSDDVVGVVGGILGEFVHFEQEYLHSVKLAKIWLA